MGSRSEGFRALQRIALSWLYWSKRCHWVLADSPTIWGSCVGVAWESDQPVVWVVECKASRKTLLQAARTGKYEKARYWGHLNYLRVPEVDLEKGEMPSYWGILVPREPSASDLEPVTVVRKAAWNKEGGTALSADQILRAAALRLARWEMLSLELPAKTDSVKGLGSKTARDGQEIKQVRELLERVLADLSEPEVYDTVRTNPKFGYLCNVLDTLGWILGEISTEAFLSSDYLDLEALSVLGRQ